MGQIGPTKRRLLQHVSSPMPPGQKPRDEKVIQYPIHQELRLDTKVSQDYFVLFFGGVLNGLGSCGILVELRIVLELFLRSECSFCRAQEWSC